MKRTEYSAPIGKITDKGTMRAIHAVNIAALRPTYVTVTDPESTIGGTSARLIDSRHGAAWQVMIANGDMEDVPVQWLSMSTERY